jgi:6,7-dimethyl-8-ribityllumazine synthase
VKDQIQNNKPISEIRGARVAIVQSKWYSEHVDNLVKYFKLTMDPSGWVCAHHAIMPGSFEIPLASRIILSQDKTIEAIVCFGAIVKGETYHFDMIHTELARGICSVMHDFSVPIINEVIAADDISLIQARCGHDNSNKGIEAAYATAEFISWRRNLKL